MSRKVGDVLWEMLANAGVKRCYGIVGDFQGSGSREQFGTTSEHLRERIGFPLTLSDG